MLLFTFSVVKDGRQLQVYGFARLLYATSTSDRDDVDECAGVLPVTHRRGEMVPSRRNEKAASWDASDQLRQ